MCSKVEGRLTLCCRDLFHGLEKSLLSRSSWSLCTKNKVSVDYAHADANANTNAENLVSIGLAFIPLLLLCDPLTPRESQSQVQRRRTHNIHKST